MRLRSLAAAMMILSAAALYSARLAAQQPAHTPTAPPQYRIIPPRSNPVITPGTLELLDLETRFQQSVADGGGKAFGTWFAEDAVLLANALPAVNGRFNIAAQARWDPKSYQLTWLVEGAQMSDSADMGFTWGHYEGRTVSLDLKATPALTSGRYFTVWRKGKDGSWKVAMDASAQEPPDTPHLP